MPTYRTRNGRTQVQVRLKENGITVFQESATFDTKKQAAFWGVNLERKLADEGYQSRQQSKVTLTTLMDMHLKNTVLLGRATVSLAHRFRTFRAYPIANKQLNKITAQDFIDWTVAHAKGRSPATLLNHLMAARAAYRAAPVAYQIPADVRVVADAINYLKRNGVVAPSKERNRRVTDDEIARIAARHYRIVSGIPLHTLMQFMVAFPRRREEVMAALWSDYDEVNRTLTLRNTKHVTAARTEVIPVTRDAAAILATLARTDARIFPYNGASVSTAFCRAAKLAEVDGVHLHDLRHEGISRLFEAGLNIPDVSLISGHSSWASLKRYTHITPLHVLDKLDANRQRAQENPAQPA